VTPSIFIIVTRWAELTAFLPSMQFSFAPWQYDNTTVDIVRKFTHLHETTIGDEWYRLLTLIFC